MSEQVHMGEPRAWSAGAGAAGELVVATWNTLADGLHDAFPAVDPALLPWHARRPRILRAIERLGADVLCLQELNHFDELQAALAPAGFKGCFAPKTDSPCARMGYPMDGCAILFRAARFECLGWERVAYAGAPQILLLIRLRDRLSGGRELVVITTHLKAKPPFEALREAQVAQLLDRLAREQQRAPSAGIIVAGDLNAEPEGAACSRLKSFGLQSAYASQEQQEQGAHFTTWKIRSQEVCHTIDYIYVKNLRVGAVLLAPRRAAVPPQRLPSAECPSDHIPLAARLSFAGEARS